LKGVKGLKMRRFAGAMEKPFRLETVIPFSQFRGSKGNSRFKIRNLKFPHLATGYILCRVLPERFDIFILKYLREIWMFKKTGLE
jgi:hypothetical protein